MRVSGSKVGPCHTGLAAFLWIAVQGQAEFAKCEDERSERNE